jgi:Glycosyl hydrolase family 59/Galactocerebrosidase, C-terminal lectin domain/Glycosyl hydrolase family 59 central domain
MTAHLCSWSPALISARRAGNHIMKIIAVIAAGVLVPVAGTARPAQGAVPTTFITVNGNGGARVFDGVGAILGGGGNARYLEEYPATQRAQILDYLFKPGYGAALQLLKLEIGGDGNSSDGAEPSIEHTAGHINCNAGYEFAIAEQAVAINPQLRLYVLQWGAPGWVGQNGSLFTSADIGYLLDWLGCAKQHGLTISYLGGWNERDDGSHATWFHSLRTALDNAGYANVQIVAGDGTGSNKWAYASSPDVAILGAHDNCGYPTGSAGAQTTCTSTTTARQSGKPLWGSELGAMDAGAQAGCTVPCAPAMDRAGTREYIDARVTGALEWPAIDSMPATVLPYENRGLLTADQPWSGSYHVNAMTWAIAHFTQFAWPPQPTNPGGWKYLNSASGFLQGNRADGSYVTLLRATRDQWSTIIETTAGVTQTQQAAFTITGGTGLATKTVHVWASNFNFSTGGPSQWFIRQPDITPAGGKFTLTIKPGYVYSLTTITGEGKGTATGPAPAGLTLPYSNSLATGTNGEPYLLAAEDGSFELAPCQAPNGSTSCTEQTTPAHPVLWVQNTGRHPYAIIGSNWANYVLSVDAMVPQSGSVGLIGRYHAVSASHGTFNGYVFTVNTDGTYTLTVNQGGTAAYTTSGQRQLTPQRHTVLAHGAAVFSPGTWHRLSLSTSGTAITASLDGHPLASLTDSTLTRGTPGITTGGWYPVYYSDLTVTSP